MNGKYCMSKRITFVTFTYLLYIYPVCTLDILVRYVKLCVIHFTACYLLISFAMKFIRQLCSFPEQIQC